MRELCQTHKLALGPDGKCVVCRRPPKALFSVREEQETLISKVFTGVLGFGLLACVASLFYVSRLDPGYTGGRYVGAPSREPRANAKPVQDPAPEGERAAAELAERQGAAGAAADSAQAGAAAPSAAAQAQTEAKPQPPQRTATSPAKPRATKAELRQVKVVMYATPWCDICDRARSFLLARDVTLIEHDIESDPAAAQALAKVNAARSVPTFEIAGRPFVGFNPWDIEDALHEAAQQSVASRER